MKYKSDIENLIVYKVGRFEGGVLETDNKKHIAILDRVAECYRADGSTPEEVAIEETPEEVAIEEMSVKQLRAYAKKNSIKIPAKLRARNDILKVVKGGTK